MRELEMTPARAAGAVDLCDRHEWQEAGLLSRCAACGLVVTARVPRFTYESDYFTSGDGGGYDFDADFSRDSDARRFPAELERLEQSVGRGTLLDIGCAVGSYLAFAKDRGWSVAGVEVADFARRRAAARAGARVVASCDDLPHGEQFDVVTLHHVLEHIDDPATFLRTQVVPRVRRRLLIEVPNFDALASRVDGPRWRDLRLEQHVTHFTRRSLSAIVASAGMRVVSAYTLWNPLWSLRETIELARYLARAGRDRRWEMPRSASGPGHHGIARYRRPAGLRRALTQASRIAALPVVRTLEMAGLAERLVVEAEPEGRS